MSSPSTARRGVLAGEVGHAAGDRRTLLHHGIIDYHWIADRAGAGRDHRRAAGPRADDRRPAADGPQPRFRRSVRSAGRHRGILSARAPRPTFMMAVLSLGGDPRLADFHWQFDGRREATGDLTATPHHLQRAEYRQSVAAGGVVRGRRPPGAPSGAHAPLPYASSGFR